jgi:UPF0755 protein
MRKRFLFLVFLVMALLAAYAGWLLFSSGTRFQEPHKFVYIRSGQTDKQKILKYLVDNGFTNRPRLVAFLAERKGYWENIRPGRYKVELGTSAMGLVNLLNSGKQEPVRMVVNKMRQLPDLARTLSLYIENDSADLMRFLSNPDTAAKYQLKNDEWMKQIIPNTYEIWWTSKPGQVIRRLQKEKQDWWSKNGRMDKAKSLGYTPDEIITIASIVEEETNRTDDRPLIASVYLNRLKIGMPLQADPTVRFAFNDFNSNRVYYKQIRTPHPYNTYTNRGLPPGPICTPTPAAIEAVLNAPKTAYIFFVANPDLRGGSIFTTNLKDHSRAAKIYQDSLTAWLGRKAAAESNKKDKAR